MRNGIYRYPEKDKAKANQEEIEKLNEEIEKINNIVLLYFDLIKGLTETISKLVKMLCDPDYKEE